MPYSKVEKLVDCCIWFCELENDGECTADDCVDDLIPDSVDCYSYYMDKTKCSKKFKNEEELLETAESIIQDTLTHATFIPFDKDSLSLILKEVQDFLNNKRHVSIIQMDENDVDKYYFRPAIDGGLVIVDKNQMELNLQ